MAYPQAALAATVVRALADCAAVVTLGLAAVPDAGHRPVPDELTRAAQPVRLRAAAGFWLFAELCRLVVGAAEAAAVPVCPRRRGHDGGVRVGHLGRTIRPVQRRRQRSWCCWSRCSGRRPPPAAVAASGIAAVGLVARTIGGHMSASSLGGIAIAVHVLAAALWCGTLAALVLTVDHRGQWARVLPRFSGMSLCA